MIGEHPYTLNVGGKLLDLSTPRIMGIMNVTPDSFYANSRCWETKAIANRLEQMLRAGADIIDVGACSTRPDAEEITEEEELTRLRQAMKVLRELAPEVPVSVDTFRVNVAREAVEDMGANIINDISGGEADAAMFETVARLGVPYVLTHSQRLQQASSLDDLLTAMLHALAQKVQQLRDLGAKDIILDPGFGFAKSMEQNYLLLRRLADLQVFGLPLLVGVSRKSMIYQLLGTTADEALNGTTVANTIALMNGANILRVHDVEACAQTIRIVNKLREC